MHDEVAFARRPDPSSTRVRRSARNPSPSHASAAAPGARVEPASSAAARPPRRERSSFGTVVHRSRRSTTRRRGTPAVGLRSVGQLGDAAFPSVLACLSPRSRFALTRQVAGRAGQAGEHVREGPAERVLLVSASFARRALSSSSSDGRQASIRSRAALESCARLCLPP
ncbi:hypothetical protein AAT19DRAFT_9413 [Rhodotorula toruloides]|uniref:Uncharacterized protein n=1 Tax=Rhodotorula toruloides TaxID=5286 RepID=A0A2T0A243_RHOTO|nr:hypothetical protein AAT19DRAFT_9413 [Rhodotorula toruloides]